MIVDQESGSRLKSQAAASEVSLKLSNNSSAGAARLAVNIAISAIFDISISLFVGAWRNFSIGIWIVFGPGIIVSLWLNRSKNARLVSLCC